MRAARDVGRDGVGGYCVHASSSGLLLAEPEAGGGSVAYGDPLRGLFGLFGVGFHNVF